MNNIEAILNKVPILEKKLNVLAVLGIQRNERKMSRLICAYLNRDTENQFYSFILRKLSLSKYVENLKGKGKTFLEYNYIDMITFFPNFFIAVENKIDAKEQYSQIKRYQENLEKLFIDSDIKGMFIFLTPQGRAPEMVKEDSKFSCYSVSYRILGEFFESKRITDPYAGSLADCMKEHIIMHKEDIKEIHEIWGKLENRLKIQKLLMHQPNMETIEKTLKHRLENFLKGNNDKMLEYSKHDKNEIKFKTKFFTDKKLHFFFMFYDRKDNPRPSLRVVIKNEDYKKHKDFLNNLREQTKEGDKCFFAFDEIPQWNNWRTVFPEKKVSPEYFVEDHDYGEGLVEELMKGFEMEYKKLKMKIKDFWEDRN